MTHSRQDHVGTNQHTPRSLRNLVNIFTSKQDIIFKAIPHNCCRVIASANFSVNALCLRQNAAENDEVILTYFEEFLAKMTENLQASADKARRALIVRCCLKALGLDKDRELYYMKPGNMLSENLNKKRPTDMGKVADIRYAGCGGDRSSHYNSSRYHAVNIHSVFTKGAVEFRYTTILVCLPNTIVLSVNYFRKLSGIISEREIKKRGFF